MVDQQADKRDRGGGGKDMSKEIEDKIKAGIIAAAPDKESAAIAKSMIDSGKIIILSQLVAYYASLSVYGRLAQYPTSNSGRGRGRTLSPNKRERESMGNQESKSIIFALENYAQLLEKERLYEARNKIYNLIYKLEREGE